ncbi:MAG: methyltransferase type 12 [Wenzhouxiangella sp.]|nr:methyltransferase type 12 [Wenzhouxiangella sp.]
MEDTEKPSSRRSTRGLDFFRGFLRSPGEVGSIIPSSRFLERRIVALGELADADCVVELGPGTGGTTRAILAAMKPGARLLTIELDAHFAGILEQIDDPRLISHTGSAADIGAILDRHGLAAPSVVISGIPFSTMPEQVGKAIIEAVREHLAPGGCFLAYQFRGHVGRLGTPIMGEPEVELEILNVPPMRFYRWRKDS